MYRKYGLDGRRMLLHTVINQARRWSPIMQDLVKVLQQDSILSRGLKEGSVCGVGNGRNILFWDDPRDGPVPLRQRFPRIFAMSSNNTTMIEK